MGDHYNAVEDSSFIVNVHCSTFTETLSVVEPYILYSKSQCNFDEVGELVPAGYFARVSFKGLLTSVYISTPRRNTAQM